MRHFDHLLLPHLHLFIDNSSRACPSSLHTLTLWPGRRPVLCHGDTLSGLGQGPPGGQQFLLLRFPKPCATILIQHAPGWPVPDRLPVLLSEWHLRAHLDLGLSLWLELLSVFTLAL